MSWATAAWTIAVAAAAAAMAVPAVAEPKPDTIELEVESIPVDARVLAGFAKANRAETRFGKLEWRGGLVLSSKSQNFGGWSGLVTDPSGKSVLAVSDAGTWMTFDLVYEAGRLSGVGNARLGPLQSLGNATLKRGRDRDAEAATLASGSLAAGNVLIAFEHNHRIGRFTIGPDGLSAPTSYVALPAGAKRLRGNKGVEAIAVLAGGPNKGSLVAIGERDRDSEERLPAWMWVKGVAKALAIRNIAGFDVTDAAALPDGGVVILERRFRWTEGVKMRLRRVDAGEIKPGALVEGEVLLEADFLSQEIDNMEGLGVHEGPDGEAVLTLISDDNFSSFLQRTILLQFALRGDDVARAGNKAQRKD